LQTVDDLIADAIVAEGAEEEHFAPKPCDRHGCVRGRSAGRDGEVRGAVLLGSLRQSVEREDLIERRDADAKEARHSTAHAYQTPVFGIEAHGSCGAFASPRCRSSIEMLSGDRMNAM
jgi:hypothetical protein